MCCIVKQAHSKERGLMIELFRWLKSRKQWTEIMENVTAVCNVQAQYA